MTVSSASPPPPRQSYSSSSTVSPETPMKKSGATKKENQFFFRNGSKLHTYGRDKAPYPLSYDREVFDLQCMDHLFMFRIRKTVTTIDFKGSPPKRCLDLGTGLGDWVIEAAKVWPECTFVGYDLVNVQVNLSLFSETDPGLADRIEWVHGNLLRQKLPFEDDEFDFVHIHGLAFAVPEPKWPSVYEEINRVLRPGGAIEQIEEDAIFPTVPKWFTAPLHATSKRPSALFPDGTSRSFLPEPPVKVSSNHWHDHALLEHLFMSVFENRFLNRTPSSLLPNHFTAVFRHVLMPPTLNFPMPPLAPLPPLPTELGSPNTFTSELSDSTSATLTDFDFEPLQTPPPSERSPISIIDADVMPFSLDDLTIYGGAGAGGKGTVNSLNGLNGVNGTNGTHLNGSWILDGNRDRSSSMSTQSTLNDPPLAPASVRSASSLGLSHSHSHRDSHPLSTHSNGSSHSNGSTINTVNTSSAPNPANHAYRDSSSTSTLTGAALAAFTNASNNPFSGGEGRSGGGMSIPMATATYLGGSMSMNTSISPPKVAPTLSSRSNSTSSSAAGPSQPAQPLNPANSSHASRSSTTSTLSTTPSTTGSTISNTSFTSTATTATTTTSLSTTPPLTSTLSDLSSTFTPQASASTSSTPHPTSTSNNTATNSHPTSTSLTHPNSRTNSQKPQRRSVAFMSGTHQGDSNALKLSPVDELASLDEHSLSMQLYRSVGFVLSVKEAMWEELVEKMGDKRRSESSNANGGGSGNGLNGSELNGSRNGFGSVSGMNGLNGMNGGNASSNGFCPITGKGGVKGGKNGKDVLSSYGWDSEEENPDVWRARFEALVERYKSDMHVRISLWHSATKYGWQYPRRDPLSKAELVEEERLRRTIVEARKMATDDDFEMPSRALRLLVGVKDPAS